MSRWFLIIDVEKCEDCNNCFLSCKDEHVGNDWPGYAAAQPLHGQRWMDIHRKERGTFPLIDVAYRPTPCMHCQNAPCEAKAENGAVYRRPDGIVIIDPEKSRGQKQIVSSCPYGAISWNPELKIPQKCTLCAHLLDKGWKAPRCVQACPTGALTAIRASEQEISARIRAEGLEPLHPEYGTAVSIFYKNLHRFDRCFIAGSVAIEKNGIEDCAAGASVAVFREDSQLGEALTDDFGDFMIDGLKKGSGPYRVECRFEAFEKRCLDVDLNDSVNLGVILFT